MSALRILRRLWPLGLLPLGVFAAWNLAHAAATGEIYGRRGWIDVAVRPSRFYVTVLADAIAALGIFGFAAIQLAVWLGRRTQVRRIDAYLARRVDERR